MGAFFILWRIEILGTIVKIISKDYYVQTAEKSIYRCSLRGKFKKDIQFKKDKLTTLDLAVIGDKVSFSPSKDHTGVIEKIEDRVNYLSRKAPKSKGALKRGSRLEQIIASNLDNLFIVTSTKKPVFNNRFLDRVIVAAESTKINICIVINKIDLDTKNSYRKWEQLYSEIGYTVIPSCAITGKGIENIESHLRGKVNIFWGQSGVGKSTLLNKMFPNLNFNVGKVSEFSQKGVHTTVAGEMREVSENTFIIDTPGIREIDPYGIKKEDLSHYFKEFLEFIHSCKFNTCTHSHEPGCRVLEAIEMGDISGERYNSYLNILNSIEDDMFY